MPSPIPGMDPFLEDPAIFPDLHDNLIAEIRNAINSQVPPPYYARSASREWVERAESGIAQEAFREIFLDIYAKPGNERLVTTIEILNATNKTPVGDGRTFYLQKQRDALSSKVNLVEIDLLRGGQHTTAVRFEDALDNADRYDYHVCVRAFVEPDAFVIYPISVGERLPVVAIPLLPGDGSIPLDLQALLDRCYDTGLYQRRVPYGERTPVPPLRPEQMAWVEQILCAKGILPAPPGP